MKLQTLKPAPKTIAIVDTNVLVDYHTTHDYERPFEALIQTWGDGALNERNLVYRRARAREAILLATYLHQTEARTFGLHEELVRKLVRLAPPGEMGLSYQRDYMNFSVYFLNPFVFPRWRHNCPTTPDGRKSNGADRELIALAKKHRRPLISCEGYSKDGIADVKMRAKAKAADVEIFTPMEFLQSRAADDKALASAALELFDVGADRFLRTRTDNAALLVSAMRGHWRHVLFGEVDGRIGAVQVRVGPAARPLIGPAMTRTTLERRC